MSISQQRRHLPLQLVSRHQPAMVQLPSAVILLVLSTVVAVMNP